ncbi:CCA tRNA nucleotidyltransferase [Salipaludibacillus daqingensis]|uniref:CCA tRNA nucleotidyltransferase n=1 Tax=Salipaludibacillus daqingensis TaxID=3041001 RepID=UPI002476F781|nr:CCA tRNA nucleotidyltransferase [Salipaludibacillus daqingensis]
MNWKQAGDKVLYQLDESGYESYIVGGAVRDNCIGKKVDDIDITTNASINEIQSIFPRTIEVGIQHGTVLVPVHGLPVQVSTFKGASIEEDLSQRDFTINAMAQNRNGDVIDPFFGQLDLKNQVIRTIGGTNKPFIQDPLRLLRAIRFALQLQFTIEPTTQVYINEMSEHIKEPAKERVAAELEKISKCRLDGEKWKWLFSQEVIKHLPYLFPSKMVKKSLEMQELDVSISDEIMWWTFALYDRESNNVKQALNKYKRSNKLTKDVMEIQRKVTNFTLDSWTLLDLYDLGKHRLSIALKLVKLLNESDIDEGIWLDTYEQLPIKQKKDLDLSGKDILEKYPDLSGWRVGDVIQKVEQAVIYGLVKNEKSSIFNWLEREYKNER